MYSLYNGGAEKSLVNLLNELPEEKYDISILLFKKEGIFLKQVPEYVHIMDTPFELKKLYSPVYKAGRFMLLKIRGTFQSYRKKGTESEKGEYRWRNYYASEIPVLNEEFDVAIAYIYGEVMYYIQEKVKAKRKLAWVHIDYRSAEHSAENDYKYFKKMDGIVSISNSCVQILREEFPDLKNKIYCIPNLTSSEAVKRLAGKNIPDEYIKGSYNLLSVGRLDEQKGFDMAITAASIIKKSGVKFKWFVIGDGYLEKTLKRQIKQEEVEDCFELIGVRENPYPYIKNCDIFIQPSRFEGKSVVMDEAKILAVPIVVTAFPTVRDQIVDGKEGLIVEMTPEKIAEGIIDLINNSDRRIAFKEYLASHEYGNHECVKLYMDVIDGNR